ncbi:MAG: SPFH domain-containing protein, partial [bacterium]
LYAALNLNVTASLGSASAIFPTWIKVVSTLLLFGLLHRSCWKNNHYQNWWLWIQQRVGWSGRKLATVSVTILLILYLLDGLFIVPAGNMGMVLSFGRVVQANLSPGLYYRPPIPFGGTVLVEVDCIRCLEVGFRRVVGDQSIKPTSLPRDAFRMKEKLDVLPQEDVPDESELLAGDENLIDLDLTVHYSITDPYQVTYAVADIEDLLRKLAGFWVLNEIAMTQVSDELTAARAEFEAVVEEGLQRSLQDLGVGVRLHGVYVVYGHAPEVVHPAYRDIASALEDKFRLINQAQRDSVAALAEARNRKMKNITQARTDSLMKVNSALGESSRFLGMAKATRENRALQEFRLNVEIAESTLVNLEKFLVLMDRSEALDLIVLPKSNTPLENLPPEVLQRLRESVDKE